MDDAPVLASSVAAAIGREAEERFSASEDGEMTTAPTVDSNTADNESAMRDDDAT
jgi:hypothetical protein